LAKAQLAATVCIAAAATVQDVARSGFIEGRLVEECNATATTTATGALGLRGALIVIGIAATATLHVNRRAGHVDRVADEKEGATTATTTAARHAVKDHVATGAAARGQCRTGQVDVAHRVDAHGSTTGTGTGAAIIAAATTAAGRPAPQDRQCVAGFGSPPQTTGVD